MPTHFYSVIIFTIIFNTFLIDNTYGRIHHLKLQNDNRHRMTLSTFGFLKGGTLAVNISMFSFKTTKEDAVNDKIFGFTLDKSNSPGLSNYVESMADCIWDKPEDTLISVFFKFDLGKKRINIIRKGKPLQKLKIVEKERKQYLFDNYLKHGENLAAERQKIEKDKSAKSAKSAETEDANKKNKKTKGASPDINKSGAVKNRKRRDTVPTTLPADAKKVDKPVTEEKKQTGDENKGAIGAKKDEKPAKDQTKVSETKEDDKTASDKKKVSEIKKAEKPASDQNKKVDSGDSKTTSHAPPIPDQPIAISDSKSNDLVTSLPMTKSIKDSFAVYQSYFLVHIKTDEEEGLYNLFFHNCLEIDSLINLTLEIIEDNNGNYLSADEMPIPLLYFVFCMVFFIVTCVWFSVLRKADEGVYKLHYLMLVVVLVKSISCLFHGINMYMIQKNGIHVDAWAILWYIVYLTRGALMFVTVLLIGAGWAFIKHVFSDKEKKLFLVVMPLQILANVAWVIVEESEEGTSSYTLWNRIFMVVDLLCCFAILFPVIWSIRHLQEASRTDGKAAINLNKLKLFRFFYIQVVCYIYFTRIIVYLLKITLPFHYGWMRNLFAEVFLLCFFSLTGYKFRPTSDNPYLQVPVDSDEEIEMEEVLTKTGNMESLTRVNQRTEDAEGGNRNAGFASTTSLKQRESSHEFD